MNKEIAKKIAELNDMGLQRLEVGERATSAVLIFLDTRMSMDRSKSINHVRYIVHMHGIIRRRYSYGANDAGNYKIGTFTDLEEALDKVAGYARRYREWAERQTRRGIPPFNE